MSVTIDKNRNKKSKSIIGTQSDSLITTTAESKSVSSMYQSKLKTYNPDIKLNINIVLCKCNYTI
jgi:hypothetical protein